MTSTKHSQQGLALLSMLLIAALATTLVVAMIERQSRLLREFAGQLQQDQIVEYARGASALAMAALQADADDNNKSDHPNEPWAQAFPPFPVPGGLILPVLRDAQSRFNLNSIVVNGAVNAPALAFYQRLLAQLAFPPELADSLVDWIDEDSIPMSAGGAEDDYYLRLNPPYRAANRSLSTYSELRLVRGYNMEIMRQLAAYVTVLPSAAKTINVNFMSPGLLEAMVPGLSPAAALEVLGNRPEDGWTSRAEFLDNPVFFGLDADTSAQLDSLLDVQSRYFELYTRIRFGDRERLQWALIARTGRRSHNVIAQERNPLWLPEFETEQAADESDDEGLAE